MYRLECDIQIGSHYFKRANNVEIKTSRQKLSDVCTITLPTTAVLKKEGKETAISTAKSLKVGDSVVVKLGYNGRLNEEFVGVVRRVNYTTPVTVDCEDTIYYLRKKTINKSWAETTLKDIINYILKDTGITLTKTIPELNFTSFYLKNMNGAQALQKFMDEYGLIIYLKGNKELYVGLSDEQLGEVKYKLGYNVVNHSIQYRTANDVRIKVKAVHIAKDNTRTEVEVGDEDGELRTLFFYDVDKEENLNELAKRKLEELKLEGYDGNLTGFLVPVAKHSYLATVIDEDYADRSGKYIIDAVTVTWGTSGGRRKVELGYKID